MRIPISKLNHVKYGHIFQDIFEVGRAANPAQYCHNTLKVVFSYCTLSRPKITLRKRIFLWTNFRLGLEHFTKSCEFVWYTQSLPPGFLSLEKIHMNQIGMSKVISEQMS